ncbi:unnamed protein product [Dicrocoelium dendriticum]|nr:unnamed protein product [Dicrocoelium dendriticum]
MVSIELSAMEGTSCLCIKLFHLEYYMSKPLTEIDVSYSDLRGAYASKVPIIRVYGTTPSGQKVCANVHGYMPYFYVTVPSKSSDYINEDFLRTFCVNLEKYIRPKAKSFALDEIIVYHASFVTGRSIYGFTDEDSVFLKVYLLDPSLLVVCADVLSSGSVLEKHFQPMETHLPFLLKFCIDYDLYGMNFMQVKHFKVRSNQDVYLDAFISTAPVDNYCLPQLLPREQLLPSDLAPRYTSTGMEFDIAACDILSKDTSQDHLDWNPGLDDLWSEERSRRLNKSCDCPQPNLPTPDELLPLSREYVHDVTEDETFLFNQWSEICQQSVTRPAAIDSISSTVSTDSEDIVSQWLQQSQEDDRRSKTSTPLPRNVYLSPHNRLSGSNGSHFLTSTQSALTASAIQKLRKLAAISEDADASIPTSIDWGFLKNTTEWKSLEILSSTQKRSSAQKQGTTTTPMIRDPMTASPTSSLYLESCAMKHPYTADSADSVADALSQDEATVLANATQSAIQHVLSQTAGMDGESMDNSVDLLDEAALVELTDTCIENPEDESDDGWSASPPLMDELWDPVESRGHNANAKLDESDPSVDSQPSFQQSFSHDLEPIDESHESTHSHRGLEQEVDEDIPPGLFSPWSSLSNASRPQTPIEPFSLDNDFQLSQPLFDSTAIEEFVDANVADRIPQLDGTNDGHSNVQDASCTEARLRVRRRRRLGLRLKAHLRSPENEAVHSWSSATRCQLGATFTSAQSQDVDHVALISTVESSTLRHCSPSAIELADQKLISSPVVMLQRVKEDLSQLPSSPSSVDFDISQRPSPRDEFEDKSRSASSTGLTESGLSGVYSFYDESLPNTDNEASSGESLGNLTLFSQSQYVPSPPPTSPPELLPIQIPVRCEPLHSMRPLHAPPPLSDVLRWLEARKDSVYPIGPSNKVYKSSQSQMSIISPIPDELGANIVRTSPGDRRLSSSSSSESIAKRDSSSVLGNSSIPSVSVLYQAASQRCFLPVQVDHTTVVSLELHCCSRLTSVPFRNSSLEQHTSSNQPPSSNPTADTHPSYGLLPDPSLDPVCLACLSFRHPVSYDVQRSRFRVDSFVLVNRTETPVADDCSESSVSPFLLGFTSAYSRPDPNVLCGRMRSTRAKRYPVRFIWCRDEWRLFNWLIYFIQSFDPDILLGYDVERHSWGYLVDRAKYLGRSSFIRELSRLAPDIVNCACCKFFIEQCGTFTEQTSVWHFDECTLSCANYEACTCPCRYLGNDPAHPSVTTVSACHRSFGWPCGPGAAITGGPFPCPGRVILCLWRVVMPEVSLFEYSLESVVLHLLKEPVPAFSWGQLHQWFKASTGTSRWRTVDYWIYRSQVNLRIVEALDLIGRTSEFARVFGIEFFHVLSRGSQYRVESMLGRTARRANFLLPSPSVVQRAHQRAPEGIPLNLEPDSRLYIDGPVAVLDFQSLYPSIVIAYNYCFSTALGRLSCLTTSGGNAFAFGCLTHSIPTDLFHRLGPNVNISPNGVVFVKACVREGILPRMLRNLLTTRLMVKDSMKLYKDSRSLTRLLDARQLALKLMANVIYGYTAANFSGRMPCVEVGDSILHKARETLERAIDLVEAGQIILPASCAGRTKPRVVYGDTDSLFVHLPGCGKTEAFDAAAAIAEAITSRNPAPIKLKVEKIYYPCLLEAKKRYVGYAYESVTQTEPTFDAKGIETVRRDSCPFVGNVLEETLRLLFDHFTLPESVGLQGETAYAHIEQCRQIAEVKVRQSIHQFAHDLAHGRISFADCILTRPYRGMASYRSSSFAPALQVARRLLALDPRAEPLVNERVVYFLAPGRLNQTLISRVRALPELYPPVVISSPITATRRALPPRLHLGYYLDKQLIPPLARMAQLIGWNVPLWLNDVPRYRNFSHQYKIASISSRESQPPFPLSLNHLGSFGSSSPMCSQSSVIPRRGTILTYKYRRRQSALLRAFLGQPVRICHSCETVVQPASIGDAFGHCLSCVQHHSGLSSIGAIRLGTQLNRTNAELTMAERICTGCLGNRGSQCDAVWLCINTQCPVHSCRLRATASLAQFWALNAHQLSNLDSLLSW